MIKYLCIKDGLVINVIVADEEFLLNNDFIISKYDLIIDSASIENNFIGIGWIYDSNTNQFSPPIEIQHEQEQ